MQKFTGLRLAFLVKKCYVVPVFNSNSRYLGNNCVCVFVLKEQASSTAFQIDNYGLYFVGLGDTCKRNEVLFWMIEFALLGCFCR